MPTYVHDDSRGFGFSVVSVDLKRVKVLLVDNLILKLIFPTFRLDVSIECSNLALRRIGASSQNVRKISFKIKLSVGRTFIFSRIYVTTIRIMGTLYVTLIYLLCAPTPTVSNYCEENPCSHLCLLSSSSPTNFSCACPQGSFLLPDGVTCKNNNITQHSGAYILCNYCLREQC